MFSQTDAIVPAWLRSRGDRAPGPSRSRSRASPATSPPTVRDARLASRSRIERYAPGADCASTLSCLRSLGVEVVSRRNAADGALSVEIEGRGLRGLQSSGSALDAGNSGTTMRLMAGIVAAHPFVTTLIGDASLTRRPMGRVIEPLSRMGARIASSGAYPPLTIHGTSLKGIDHHADVPSAQVKSAVLLAGLQAEGITRVQEPATTRNHTELALGAFVARVTIRASTIELEGGQRLLAGSFVVPGDLSSAAFWAVAAAALPGSEVNIDNVSLNPTRTALLEVLRRSGALVEVEVEGEAGGEASGRMQIRHGHLASLVIGPAEVPGLIDEIPALAAWATHGGDLLVTGAGELRVKETDRISSLVRGFQRWERISRSSRPFMPRVAGSGAMARRRPSPCNRSPSPPGRLRLGHRRR